MENKHEQENDKIDALLKHHIDSLPKFEGTVARDRQLYNEVLAKAQKKRAEQHNVQCEKQNIFSALKDLILGKLFISPKFAIPLALILIVATTIFVVENSGSNSKEVASNNQIRPTQNSAKHTLNDKNDLASSQSTDNNNLSDLSEKYTDYAAISYDYSNRSSANPEDSTLKEKMIKEATIAAINSVFEHSGIPYKKIDSQFETEWFNSNNKPTKLQVSIIPENKSVLMKVKQSDTKNDNSQIKYNLKKLRKEINDNIYQAVVLIK